MNSVLARKISIIAFTMAVFVWLGVFISHPPSALAAPARCYSQTTSGSITQAPGCDYNALGGSGYVMTGLPNPLADDQCYYWTNDSSAPGQVVDCSRPEYANAPAFGSNTPPPVDIDRATDATNQANLQNQINNPQRAACDSTENCVNNNPLTQTILIAINFLSAAVGIVVIIAIVIGGIQYSTAGGNPNATSAAKKRILNAIIALVAYMLLFMFLQWIIPGGLL